MATRQPWFKQFPADWRGDTNLRACSLAARGLWAECLGLMHEAEPRGYLVFAGEPVSVEKLALLVGRPLKEVRAALAELEHAGVPSRDAHGTMFSRRMVRDTARAIKAAADGARGGNPTLKGRRNGQVNGTHIPARAQTRDLGSEDESGRGEPERGLDWQAHCPHSPKHLIVTSCPEAWAWLKSIETEQTAGVPA